MNFILIYTDELQFSDLASYGGKFPTPNIDRLASEGIQFMQAHTTASMCTPSRYSVMTGQVAGRCQFPDFLENNPKSDPYSIAWNTFINDNVPTLPRLLATKGYYTGMAGKWHIGKLPDTLSIPQLNAADDPTEAIIQTKLAKHQQMVAQYLQNSAGFDEAKSVLWENFDVFPVKALHYHNIPWITKGGITFMQSAQKQQKPFFLYIAPTAIHGPNHFNNLRENLAYTLEGHVPEVANYQPDSATMLTKASAYNPVDAHRFAGIAHIDYQVGKIIEYLEVEQLYDNTAIIFMADHNIEPGKATCYEKGTNLPMIVRWPGGVKGVVNQETLVQNTDILPTILAATGSEELPKPLDGFSLLPVLQGERKQVRSYVFSEAGYTRSVSDGQYKYIALRFPEAVNRQINTGALLQAPNYLNKAGQAHSRIAVKYFPHYFDADQLYDLQNDPYEQENVSNDPAYSEKKQQLQEVMRNHLATISHPFPLEDKTLNSLDYKKLSTRAREQNRVDDIVWFARDHGDMIWPPKMKE